MDSAADTNIVPLGGEGWGNTVWIDGHDATQRQDSNFSSVSPGYFETLRIPRWPDATSTNTIRPSRRAWRL